MTPDFSHLPRFAFGDSADMADDLLALVLKGRKTATCSDLGVYKNKPETMPAAGQRWIVLNGAGEPACVIEITEVTIRRYCDIDADFAAAEGEGDLSLAYWRNEHRDFFTRAGSFREDMALVCERFKVIHRF